MKNVVVIIEERNTYVILYIISNNHIYIYIYIAKLTSTIYKNNTHTHTQRPPSPELDILETVYNQKKIIVKPKIRVENRTTKWILTKYEMLIQDIHNTYRKCSSVQTMQRYLRGFLTRKYVLKLKQYSSKAATDIQKLARGYILRQRMNDELKELLDEEDQHLLISHHDLQKVCTFLCIYIYTDVYIYIF